ncbi:MAG: FAD-binding oxidoreductase [Actinomycetota bacterium]
MDLRPADRAELAGMLRAATADGRVLDIRGGGLHARRGRPFAADDVLHTAGLARVVDYVPEDMTITVEGGVSVGEVLRLAGERGQGWPQAPSQPADTAATVGGVLAAAAGGRRRLRFGPIRDSLLEVVVATGDGRIVKGGGRTVKSVTGYDLPRLLTGSLGTLGVIVQATLRLWPLPMAEQWFSAQGTTDEMLDLAQGVLADLHRPTAVIAGPASLHVCLTGVPDDVVAPAGMVDSVEPHWPRADTTGAETAGAGTGTVAAGAVEAGVPPAALPALARQLAADGFEYEAWMGTGICRVAVWAPDHVLAVRELAMAHRGHAQVIDGDDALRTDPFGPVPAGADIMRRIRASFDPAGILCPGCFAAAEAVPA